MKIICPNCQTAYEIPADKIGNSGRKVKCATCSNVWRATLEDAIASEDTASAEMHSNSTSDAPSSAAKAQEPADKTKVEPKADSPEKHEAFSEDDLAPKPSENSGSYEVGSESSSTGEAAESDTTATSDEPQEQETEDDSHSTSTKAARSSTKKTKSSRKSGVISAKSLLGAGLFSMSLILCVAAVQYREQVVRSFPDLAGLYQLAGMTVNLRGLVFKDLRTYREVENEDVILVVEGIIENIKNAETVVPAVKLAMRSQDTQEIYTWVVEPRVERLAPGDKTRFRARLDYPPERAADIQLRFVERQKKRASIR